ncbi:MAG: 50S ribosomal protein L4 [Candidatus Lambdaproteobacteria bacterium]|nr:50S ribosomal protein L4 [Candidatus Lambdaproteobacteria bacterium]
MAQVKVLTLEGAQAGEMELDDRIAAAPYHPFLVKDAVVYQMAKARQGTHATKTRSMVSGSTKKQYRQKGTGHARMGDRKAPQRRGGGIVHGPLPRDHATELNKKVRKAALRTALAERLRSAQVLVLDGLELSTHKTRGLIEILAKLEAPSALIVVDDIGRNLALAARNLPEVEVIHFSQLNVYNLLRFEKALVTKGALAALQTRLAS